VANFDEVAELVRASRYAPFLADKPTVQGDEDAEPLT
jgi:hypothetical protein